MILNNCHKTIFIIWLLYKEQSVFPIGFPIDINSLIIITRIINPKHTVYGMLNKYLIHI